MDEVPLVSIITINYNNKDGLEKTLKSVMSQSFSDYEHVIIDGASSDGSVDVIKTALKNKKYSSHISYWCSEKDGGIYPAMNKGLSHVKGRFILMLNSGDWFSNDCVLANVAPYLLDSDNSIVYGTVDYFNGDNYVCAYSVGAAELLQGKNICHQACFISKNIHEKIGVYDTDYKLWADYDFMLKAYTAGASFVHIPIVIANCEKQGASNLDEAALKKDIRRIIESYPVLKKTFYDFTRGNVFIKSVKMFLKLLLPGFVFELLKLCKGFVAKFARML